MSEKRAFLTALFSHDDSSILLQIVAAILELIYHGFQEAAYEF